MTLNAQAQRLLTAGVADGAGVSAAQLAAHAARLPEVPGAVLAVHPTLAAPGQLAGLLRRGVGRGSSSRT